MSSPQQWKEERTMNTYEVMIDAGAGQSSLRTFEAAGHTFGDHGVVFWDDTPKQNAVFALPLNRLVYFRVTVAAKEPALAS